MSQQPRFQPPNLPPLPSNISQTVFLLWTIFTFVLGYWVFARFYEQIDLAGTTPILWPEGMDVPPLVQFIREFIHWRVLRHFLPVLLGWWLAYEASIGLVRVLYELPDRTEARRFLAQLINTASAANARPVAVTKSVLRERRDHFAVLRIGGPGKIGVKNGYVAVTEQHGRIHQIIGNGSHYIDSFEYVHDVLDLRLQERIAEKVTLISKDGVPVTATISLQFRLDTGGEQPTRSQPFPFAETAVKTAAYAQQLRPDGTVSRWDDLPLPFAKEHLIRIFSKHPIDTILMPPGSDNHGLSSAPLLSIRNELATRLRESLGKHGVELVDVQISQIELPEDVTTQYIKYWQSDSDARIRLSLADGEASALEEMEMADAEAEMTMIRAILEGVHRAKASGNGANMRDVVALRLIEAMEKMARQTQQVASIPDSQQLIAQIDTFRAQLSDGIERLEETAVVPEPEPDHDEDDSGAIW